MLHRGDLMPFKNENTFFLAGLKAKEKIVHSRYERALGKLEEDLGRTMQNYINGRWVGSGGGFFEDRFPGDISVVNGRFQKSTKDDARSAIKAARTAYDSWRLFDYQSRRDIFERAASIMSKRKYEMAAMVTLENGKNRYEAMADIDEAIDFLRYYSLQMRDTLGYAMDMPSPFPSERPRDLLRPYGVWGVISPFNFPWSIMAGMSNGAMIAGNTVVLKPASDAPWPALTFAEILEEAKLPPGVFNVVTSAGETVGRELVENKSISGLAFTGSKAVGTDALKTFLGVSPRLSSPRWEGRMLSSSPARQIWMKLQKVWAGQPSVTVAKSAVPALAFWSKRGLLMSF